MDVAEIFLSAFISLLFDKLASTDLRTFARRQGIYTQLNKWLTTLYQIRAVLGDAEEKQITDTAVKMWLEELKDLAYDLDDILDKISTQASIRNLKTDQAASTSTNKVFMSFMIPTCCTNFPTPRSFMFDRKMRSEMDEISTRLEEIFRQKSRLGLEVINVKGMITDQRVQLTSVVDESLVFGRDNDKGKILQMLLKEANPPEEVFSVIPIVGMGGVGKTTLAQLVYNDQKVNNSFDLKLWVCVSQEFDVLAITKIMLESVAPDIPDIRASSDLNQLQVSLKERLSKKRFLIVLDDVWNRKYEKWDLLCRPLRAGAPGSKIIVTTRDERVASTMSRVRAGERVAYHLDVLEDNDCLSLLCQHALGTTNFDEHSYLKVIGEAIVRNCKGFPLAAKALGGLLSTDRSPKYWKEIMTSKIWDIPEGECDILPALRLSYYHLPSHLKQLFAYCSIFPYDYVFDRDELVLLWMAEGFLQQSEWGNSMEELGCDCFKELLSRSFFQCTRESESRFVMPNVINDLAQVVSRGWSFKWDSETRSGEEYAVVKKARHSSFIRRKCEVLKNFKNFHGITALRTFLPLPIFISYGQEFYLSNGVLIDLLPRLLCLRVFSISGYSISEIPESIGELKQLRYLNCSDTLIRWLPESVSNLNNLQTLLLRRCRRLTKLPIGIGNLVNLRHLDCTDTNQLREMPPGIGKLTNLRTLSKIVLGKDNGLGELRSFSDIQGKLTILGLHTVRDIEDAEEALSSKHGLEEITMEWCNSFYDYLHRRREKVVLDVLQPHTNLKKLKLIHYGGTKFPEWVGGISFLNMVVLELRNCTQCTSLPSLGQLPSLKKLHIHGIDRVKRVDVEFYGAGCLLTGAFPSLETLSFEEMPDWKEWSTLNGVNIFPCLRELIISDCPDLTSVSLSRLPSLRVLKLNGCHEVVLKCMLSFSSLTTLTIQGISGLTQLQKEAIPFFGKLEILEIKQCREMMSLWEEECPCKQLVSLGGESGALLESLKILSLDDCPNLNKLPNGLKNLTSLQGLRIENCPKIVRIPDTGLPQTLTSLKIGNSKALEVPAHNNDSLNFSHLEKLWIEDCSSLAYFPIGDLPSTLKELRILHCMKLEQDVETPLSNCKSSLEHLTINGWMKFKTFPPCFVDFERLTELIIQGCPGLESFPEEGFPPNLRRLSIRYCASLKLLPDQM